VVAGAVALLALVAGGATSAPIPLGASERIVFYGDSITEQNRYTGLVQTFLTTRYPDKHLDFYNYGWSGDTARGGNARWARDAAGAKPTLLFADFGMNDGAYGGFDPWILDAWLPPLKGILDQARAGGARAVLFSPSVTDPHDAKTDWLKGYDDTLASMVKAEIEFGVREGVPVVDLNTPMRAAMARARKQKMETMVPDGIHPNAAGALLMAWSILRAFEPPKGLGDITVSGSTVTAGPDVKVGRPARHATTLEFDLQPAYLPFWVPWESRSALSVCSFTEDLNRFRLVIPDRQEDGWLMVDGRPVSRFTAAEVRAGIDLTAVDAAPWARAGRTIWELAQRRNAMRFEAWRTIELGGRDWGGLVTVGAQAGTPAAAALEQHRGAARALNDAGEAMADQMRALATPPNYHVLLSSVPPYSRRAGLPQVVEGFEDATLARVNTWDESAAASSTTDHPTEGARALQVSFDAAVYGAPGATVDLAVAQDFSETPHLAVDVALRPGSLPAGSTAAVTLTLNPEETNGKGKNKKKEHALKPVELTSGQTLADGGHATLVYDLTGASPEVLRRTASVTLTLSFSPTGGRGAVIYDNLRAVP